MNEWTVVLTEPTCLAWLFGDSFSEVFSSFLTFQKFVMVSLRGGNHIIEQSILGWQVFIFSVLIMKKQPDYGQKDHGVMLAMP